MKKKVLLLAVSCKNGGLCPGGIDLENPREWIRIVKNDGQAGAVQGIDIDFAKPLDIIEFDGHPMPFGVQRENWCIDNHSCKKEEVEIKTKYIEILSAVYNQYAYHGFWGNCRPYLTEEEYGSLKYPSETIMRVSNVKVYNSYGKGKIDFFCENCYFEHISMTDQDFYEKINSGYEITFNHAYVVASIPAKLWEHPVTQERRAYKFVSKVFGMP